MDENKKVFYERTINMEPNPNIKRIIQNQTEPNLAIDIGCGAGRDTVALLKNGWKVIAIDKEDVKELIEKQLSLTERDNFTFICSKFEKMKLKKNNLIVANNSIAFCDKKIFNEVWERIVRSLKKNRYFCWNFFWE